MLVLSVLNGLDVCGDDFWRIESIMCVLMPFEALLGFMSVFSVSFECSKWFVCVFGWFWVILVFH
ncbi:hypothetical protein E2C01_005465 [Portunus trituberculatus]|uniref:Uncharacterized protein n=1 Tax=Portunus trituberculatus TaxID=210409 RepID=A0A5B7CUG8_PORTR|nr:hypothetical protein [Portunus trituberculatus]